MLKLRVFSFILIVAAILSIVSCSSESSEPDSPDFERIIPETGDENSQPDPGLPEPDLDYFIGQVNANPDDPGIRFAYLTSLVNAEDFPEALEQARILGGMGGENPFRSIAYLNFAQIVLDNIPEDDPGRVELVIEAMDGLWIALGWEPESIPAHKALGRLALESGDDEKALHHLSIVLSVTEIGYELRTSMAEIYIERGEPDRARVHLEEALILAEEAEETGAVRSINRMLRNLD